MAGRIIWCLLGLVCLGSAVGSATIENVPLVQVLEDDLYDSAEWIRIPSIAGEWIWTHRRSISGLLKQRQSVPAQQEDVQFRLYTRQDDGDGGYPLELSAEDSFAGSNFRPERPTRVVVHGWQNSGRSPCSERIREAYLRQWDYNVIVVDWSACAMQWNYIHAVRCVPLVGQSLALLLNKLQQERGMRMEKVYLIGHSLGAHIAGIAGKLVEGGQIDTIVALDPALPLFSMLTPTHRVSSRDARYVEVIHTNGGLLGFLLPIGTADFYPNGGTHQPGCGLNLAGMCSHSRAWELFVESLRVPAEKLLASRVDSLQDIQRPTLVQTMLHKWAAVGERVKMGGEPSSAGHARGLYFIDTRSQSPFFVQ